MMEKIVTGKFLRFYFHALLLCCSWFLFLSPANAVPFNKIDARTMAMGGVGIATGTHNAVFNNPALMTTADEIHEWFLLLPAVSQERFDIDDLKGSLSDFKVAVNTFDQSTIQAALNNLDGIEYHTINNTAVMLAIPGRILSGAIFLNSYEMYSAKPVIGGDVLSIPTYVSTLAHRGVRVVENGVSAARILDTSWGWFRNMAVGFNAKFLLVETYNYETDLRLANVSIDRGQGVNGSQFGLDIGALKEFGVWKIALVGKNLIAGNYEMANTNNKLEIDPQLRAGFAYQSRRSVIEFNLDLINNYQVGFEPETQIAAVGWEFRPRHFFAMRAGFSQNLVGTNANSFSAGIGLNFSGIHFDLAAYNGNEGLGMAGQFGIQF